jgi:hypothetical protein
MDQNFKDQLLIDIATSQKAISVQIAEIKEDLKYHIKRTHQNEVLIKVTEEKLQKDISFVKKHVYFVQGAIGLMSFIAIVVTILARLNLV